MHSGRTCVEVGWTGPEDLTGRRLRAAEKGLGLEPGCQRGAAEGRWGRRAARTIQVIRSQILLSMKAASWVLDSAPTFWASRVPFLNSISVGIPRTLYLGGV